MEFSLLDHLIPCLPCLARLRGQSRISLLSSPHASNSDSFDDQRDRLLFDTERDDALSLHSNVDGLYNRYRDGASPTLSRWQLFTSWWRSDPRKRPRFYHSEEADAEELLPEDTVLPTSRRDAAQPFKNTQMPEIPTQDELDAEEMELARLEEEAAQRRQERRTRRLQLKAAEKQREYEQEEFASEWGPLQTAPKLTSRSTSSSGRSGGTASTVSEDTMSSSVSEGRPRRMRRKSSRSSNRRYEIHDNSETRSDSTAQTSVEGEALNEVK